VGNTSGTLNNRRLNGWRLGSLLSESRNGTQ